MTRVSSDIARSIADLVAIGEIDADATPESITDLIITHARDLTGLEAFTHLHTLGIVGAQVPTFGALADLPELRVLEILHTNLADTAELPAATLRVVRLRHNRVTSIGGLADAPELQVLDVAGNPLDDAALRTLAHLTERGVICTRDDDAVVRLNRLLVATSSPFACSGTAEECLLTLTGLDHSPVPERAAARTTTADVEVALRDGTLAEALAQGET